MPPQARYAKTLEWLARAAFFVTLILIPVRLRLVLLSRPVDLIYSDYTDFLLYLPDIAMLLTLTFWGLSLILSPRKLTFGPRHIWIPLIGLTAAGWLSIQASFDRALSTYHAIRLVSLFAFYVFIVNEVSSVLVILISVGLQVAIQSTVAIAQFVAQRSVELQALGEFHLDPAVSGVSIVFADGVRLLRAYGLSDHPNILGGCLAFSLLALLSAYFHAPTRSLIAAVFLPGLIALLLTFSRSAWLAFALSAACLLGFEIIARRRESIAHLPILVATSLLLLAPFILAYPRFFGVRLNAGYSLTTNPIEQRSIDERVLLIRAAVPMLNDHLLTGVGLGTAPIAMKAYFPTFPIPYQPPHFTLFDALVETGLPGAVFYFLLMVSPIAVFIVNRESFSANAVILTSAAILFAITIVGFFDYYTWLLVPGRLWQWSAWGLWGAALSQVAPVSRQPVAGPIR